MFKIQDVASFSFLSWHCKLHKSRRRRHGCVGKIFALFEGTPADILCSVAGIAACISVAKILEERQWRFLDHLLGATSLIFLLSWYFNIASQQVLSHFVKLPWWVYSALSLVSGIYIPRLAYRYLERHRDSRWVKVTALLLGQSFRKKTRKQ